jgi:hypothetical protein
LSRLDVAKYDAIRFCNRQVKEFSFMPDSTTSLLPTCPDCGGILHPTRIERLTSIEVASADDDDALLVRQCLICGYTEQRARDTADRGRPAPA